MGGSRAAIAKDAAPDAVPADLTPAQALQRLLDGNQRFSAGKARGPHRSLERVHELAGDQKPFAAILSCADSRVPVELLFDQGFGDLFVVRNAGNVTAPQEFASLEYGTAVLGAKVLLVLGHSSCGAVKAAMAGKAVPGQISVLYQHIRPAVDSGGGDLAKTIADNVRFQAANLAQASPVIAELVQQGKLQVASAVYDLASGVVTPIAV
jgi:carbonic anhydrase